MESVPPSDSAIARNRLHGKGFVTGATYPARGRQKRGFGGKLTASELFWRALKEPSQVGNEAHFGRSYAVFHVEQFIRLSLVAPLGSCQLFHVEQSIVGFQEWTLTVRAF